MRFASVFKRYEIKYLITRKQYEIIRAVTDEHMHPDKFGRSVISNLYFDTEDYRLIRRSVERPVYKEKLRLRGYGDVTDESQVFLEIKKKYQSVVYKRRINMTQRASNLYLSHIEDLENSQIKREIDYFIEHYSGLRPRVYISYEREAFYDNDDPELRLTFDDNILWREDDLSLMRGAYGERLLDDDLVLMEIKTASAIPLWFTRILSENHIYKTSFSKYGTVYETIQKNKSRGVRVYA